MDSNRRLPKGNLDVQFKFLNLPPFDWMANLRTFLRRLLLRVQTRWSEPLSVVGFFADGFNCFSGYLLQSFFFVNFLPELSVPRIMDLFMQDTEWWCGMHKCLGDIFETEIFNPAFQNIGD